MVTEVFTVKYCDPHAIREEKVEATEIIQFAYEGAIREVDACAECRKDYDTRIEPLVDYSRPVKRTRKAKAAPGSDAAASGSDQEPSEDE